MSLSHPTLWEIHAGATGDALVELILAHCDQFDPRFKARLPLKRVYIPAPIEESE